MSSSMTFQEKLKALYRRNNKLAPLIEGLEDKIPQQSLENYYVKLKTIIKVDLDKRYINYEKIPGKKQEIDIEALFDPLETANKPPVNKLLIVGGAGVGKSTLMQYITYRWSQGELWKDKFDYVYRVSLKTLLNRDWDHNYGRQGEDDDDILKCLVHYHLIAEERGFCSLQEIPWKEEKKLLLLLDGYDEVVHERKGIYKQIFEDIFDHKNIILTSRPNAIDKEMAEKFGRKIENIGFDDDGIHHYLTKYFKNNKAKGLALEEYLEKNLSLKDICRIPVNFAMICFIWAQGDDHEALYKVKNMSHLYYHMVDHLGFRYYVKQEINARQSQQDLECIWKGQEIYLDELKVLQHCAYKGMTGGGIEVPDDQRFETLTIKGMTQRADKHGVSIQSSINYLSEELNRQMPTINKVYRYGLLKPEEANSYKRELSETDLQAQNFCFIHLSFQEFFTAQYFAEKLIEENNDHEQADIANFIAQHRNEPRYLMMLKFMAGLLCAKKGRQAEKGIKIFWDAVMCNPDGVLELGVETKVTLLMHLFSQTAQEDGRIPNCKTAMMLIDSVVLRDLAGWSSNLRESDYLNENIKEGLMQYFVKKNTRWLSEKSLRLQKTINPKLEIENNLNTSDHVDDIMIMISAMINRFSKEEQEEIFQRVLEILKDSNEAKWQCTKKAIESIIIIHRKTKLNLYLSTQKEVLDSLLIAAYDNNLNEISSKAIEEIISNPRNPALIDELIKSTKEGLENDLKPELQYRKIKTVIEVLKRCHICDTQFTRDLVHALIVLSQDSNQDIRTSASKDIIYLVKVGDPELASYAITDLLPLLKYRKWNVKTSASETILELVKYDTQLIQNVFSGLASLLLDGQQHTKTLALKNIAEFVMIDKKLAEDAINIICPVLKDSNLDVRISALKKILVLVKIANDIVILQDVLKIFIELFGDPDFTIRDFALDNIIKLVKSRDKNDPELLTLSKNLLQAMTPLLKSQNLDVRISALKRITELVKFNDNAQLFAEALEIFSEILQDSEPRVKTSASKNIIELMKRSDHKDPQLFQDVLGTLNLLLQNSNPDISTSASKNLIKLLKINPSDDNILVENVIKALIPLLEYSDDYVRKIASESIISATMQSEKRDQLARFTIDEILRRWENPALDGRKREIEILPKLIKIAGNNSIQDVITVLTPFLRDLDCRVRISASNCITEVARLSNDTLFIRNAIENILRLILEDSHTSVRKATSKNIILLIIENSQKDPDLFQNMADKLLIFSQKSQWNVKTSVSEIIAGLLKLRDENDPQRVWTVLRTLTPILSDPMGYARKAASDSIIGLMHVSAENDALLITRVLKTLTPLLEDQNSYVRKAVSDNIIELIAINQNPENDLIRDLIGILCPILQNSESYIRKIASYNIAELVNYMNDHQNIESIFQKIFNVLSPLLRDSKQDVRNLAAKKILELALKINETPVFNPFPAVLSKKISSFFFQDFFDPTKKFKSAKVGN